MLHNRLKKSSAIQVSVATMPASIHDDLPLSPLTSPEACDGSQDSLSTVFTDKDSLSTIDTAIHVMSTERAALAHLEQLYQNDRIVQENVVHAVDQILRSVRVGGKLVLCGVGKSGKIARKIEATMISLGVSSVFLHPTEALHGDLGIVQANDTLLVISFSGRTQELHMLLPHIPPSVPVIAITKHLRASTCPVLSYRTSEVAIALPAPVHEDEQSSFGVNAPTSSTTAALCLGDALALGVARRLHTSPTRGPAEVFKGFHPGGAIGASTAAATALATAPAVTMAPSSSSSSSGDYLRARQSDGGQSAHDDDEDDDDEEEEQVSQGSRDLLSDRLVPLDKIPTVSSSGEEETIRLLDVLLAAVQAPEGKSWVALRSSLRQEEQQEQQEPEKLVLVPPRHLRGLSSTDVGGLPSAIPWDQFLLVPGDTRVDEVRRLVRERQSVVVVAGMDGEDCLGVVDGEDL